MKVEMNFSVITLTSMLRFLIMAFEEICWAIDWNVPSCTELYASFDRLPIIRPRGRIMIIRIARMQNAAARVLFVFLDIILNSGFVR